MALSLALSVPYKLGVRQRGLRPEHITDNNCNNFTFYDVPKRLEFRRASKRVQQFPSINVPRTRTPKLHSSGQFMVLADHFQDDETISVASYSLQGEKMNIRMRGLKQSNRVSRKLPTVRFSCPVTCRYTSIMSFMNYRINLIFSN